MKKRIAAILLTVSVVSNQSLVFGMDGVINTANTSAETSQVGGREEVQVNEERQTITGTRDQVILTLGSKKAYVNGEEYQLTNPPMVVEGRTFLPLRFVVDEMLGAQVEWNKALQQVTVQKGEKEVIVRIGESVAYVNGIPVTLDAPPILENGTTLLPVRFMSEAFALTTEYKSETKQVIVTSNEIRLNHPPVAQFNFKESSYTEGQKIEVVEYSTDEDQDKIVERLWQVSGDATGTNTVLSNILNKPKAGTYVVALKVKDKRGLWSEWVEKTIEVLPNRVPEITYLQPLKASYAQGEGMQFTYNYSNENWEEIVNEKWTYRHADEPVSKAILGKPKAMFTEGEYIITLEIDDAYGNRSTRVETRVNVTDEVLKSELMYRFTEGNIGEMIDNYEGINYRDYKDAQLDQVTSVAGTLLMSNSPEIVKRDGLLYRERINGKGRLLVHHLNGLNPEGLTGDNRRLVVVAENTSNQPVTLTIKDKTFRGPATDILRVGQKMLYDYLTGTKDEVYVLQPGERKYIYDSKASKWLNGQCISGLMALETTGEVTITTAAVKHGVTIDNMFDMELLPKDVHPRGTFDTTEIHYSLNIDSTEPTKLLIGTGEGDWVTGHDAITGEAVLNKGNFGVSYKITLRATEDTGIILNPRANEFMGAIKWDDDASKVYNIPENGSFSGNTAKAAVLGVIKAGETKTFEYMLPNGSAAPVLIGFIPMSYWNK